jgi:hypothetical protein
VTSQQLTTGKAKSFRVGFFIKYYSKWYDMIMAKLQNKTKSYLETSVLEAECESFLSRTKFTKGI